MKNRRHTAAASAVVVAAAMVLTAACGGSDSSEQKSDVQPAGDSSSLAPGYGSDGADNAQPSEDQQGEAAGTLALRDVPELGQVVTDSSGLTLYRFDKDSAEPPKSNCEGDCATAWPAVPADDAKAAAGVDSELLGEVERSDGTSQLTLGGWPVYRYAKDNAAGDTNGHGVGGTWHALAADGGKAEKGKAEGGKGQDKGNGKGEGGSAPAGNGAELSAVEDPELGSIVTDAQGRTLYRFDKDSAWPMKSNCTGACLETWKPAKMVDKNSVSGVAAKDVIEFNRPDGTKQLTIDCWPLYWYTGDEEPGDTNGHGVGGTWHAVTPEGKKARKAASAAGS
ncbi:SCO0930 family lipoprotein [Streptomyces gobiensis]|uniref:SCO0930 family lipoprotein n=1 Tax=Streptomyces gobiensis TaxID=2875706 RepID=UPI001E2BA1CA|nr:SCO0930 family lipoprotein [Streptomyces gobiensis]UGY90331.1 SCO0930 family lipoprotein [Streptomyces gobiensis]